MVAGLVPPGSRLADVGTDHAYLPAALIQEGTIPAAIAADLRQGPLNRAKTTVRECELTGKVAFRLCSGLEGIRPEEADAVCDRMEELGYLNEADYAAQIVRVYSARGFGEKKLRDELYRRGVPRDYWDDALEQIQDSTEAIDAFLEKKLAGWTGDRKQLQKVTAALARRGFSWSDIRDALARYETGIDIEYD